jgi:hypothetical protein
MAFREVSVVQIKELLRLWLKGSGERTIAESVGIDRKTVRRYLEAAKALGLERSSSEAQLTDELIGQLLERVRPHRPDGHGDAWRVLLKEEARIKAWVDQDLTVVKIGVLLGRNGIVVPHRTLARFCVERLGTAKRATTTVRVNDPPPGVELQVDFGRLGLVPDGERRRVCQGLIFTACFSRHSFVWPTFKQTTEEVIKGFEAAWGFFGGVFPVVISEYVPRNIFGLMCPVALCGAFGVEPPNHGGGRAGDGDRGHITLNFSKGDFFIPYREKGSCHVGGILHEAGDGRSPSRVVDRCRDRNVRCLARRPGLRHEEYLASCADRVRLRRIRAGSGGKRSR